MRKTWRFAQLRMIGSGRQALAWLCDLLPTYRALLIGDAWCRFRASRALAGARPGPPEGDPETGASQGDPKRTLGGWGGEVEIRCFPGEDGHPRGPAWPCHPLP